MAALGKLSLLGLLALLASCGDSQRNAQFRGAPIWRISGTLASGGSSADGAPSLRMALFFSAGGLDVLDPEQWVEHLASAVKVQVPSNYELNIFEAPSSEHMLRLPDGTLAGYAIGRLLVYVDSDLNGRHSLGEAFVGIAPPVGIYYAPQPLSKERAPTNGSLPAGFSQVLLPQPCEYLPPLPTDSETCGVPLGERCTADTDCMGGLCLKETKIPWPAGYCTIPEPPPNGCRPANAVFMRRPRYSPTPAVAQIGLYLRSCTADADCVRPKDPDQGLFSCDVGLRGCVPASAGVLVPVGGQFQIEPFCAM